MESFLEFLSDVFGSWVETAGIILTVVPFIEKIPLFKNWLGGKPILERYARVLWFIGGVCIIWGFYSAWKDQNAEVQKAKTQEARVQASLDAINKPILTGEIIGISSAPSGEHKENTLVTIAQRIRNNGAPTALEDFHLTVTKQGREVKTQYLPQVDLVKLYYGPNNRSFVLLHPEDHVGKVFGSHVLDRHALADGWFQAVVFGLNQQESLSTQTVFVVSYRDIATGSEHSMTHRASGRIESPLDIQKLSRQTR